MLDGLSTGRLKTFLRPPRNLLALVRWIFLVSSLLIAVLIVPIPLSEPALWWPIRPAAFLGLIWLCFHWIRGYKRESFPYVLTAPEGLAVFTIALDTGLTIGDPASTLGLIYSGLMFRSLYGSRRQTLVTLLVYLGAFYGAVVVSVATTNPELPLAPILPHLLGLTLMSTMLHLLATILAKHERSMDREKILRRAGAALAATQDRESVYTIALDAALELTKENPKVRVGLTRGSTEEMTVVASAGYRAAEIRGDPLNIYALPDPLRTRFLEKQAIEVEHAEAGDPRKALGLARKTRSSFMIPLFIQEELRGAIGVTSESPLSAESKNGLKALGFQVALALENVTFAEDRHWRQSEVRFHSLIQNSSDIVMVADADGIITYITPSVQRILGYTPKSLIGKEAFALVHPEDAAQVRDFHAENTPTPGTAPPLEVRMRHLDGSWRYLEGIGNNLLDDPDIRGIVINMRDVTDRKQAEEALRESEERFRAMVQNASDVITVLDSDGTVLYQSPAVERVLGYRPEEQIGTRAFDSLHPDDVERALSIFAEVVRTPGAHLPIEFRAPHADGSLRYLENVVHNLLDNPAVKGIVVNSRDITERKQVEEELRRSEERFRSLVQNSLDVIAMVDANATALYHSPSIERVMGYKPEEFMGKNTLEVIPFHPDDLPRVQQIFRYLVENPGANYSMELRIRHADGSWRVIEATANNLLDDPSVGGIVINYRDITERKAFEEQLAHQAFHDDLTGLPNRALFMNRLEQALARTDRHRGSVAVLFLDLDNFKVINDSLGHKAGDELLVGVAERLQGCLRPADTVARLSGDEFIVLLEEVAQGNDATKLAERLAGQLRAPFRLKNQDVYVTTSIGIAFGTSSDDRPDDLLRKADVAMYRAKSRGKARYKVFDVYMDAEARERLRLETDLRRAIERKEFRVCYQPKVLLETGGIFGIEALVRWEHPQRGLLSPLEFISIAEETGLIYEIGQWVLGESCRQAREWHEQNPDETPVMVYVNLSAKQFQHPALTQDVARILQETGLDERLLGLEITESVAMEHAQSTIATLNKLKDLGVKLALDDFGTGYSSFSHLKRFPIDYLKIDRSFVDGLGEDAADVAVASGIITLAHTLEMQAIAEGVETADQLRALQELGCDMAQGYYFYKPLPSEAVSSLLLQA